MAQKKVRLTLKEKHRLVMLFDAPLHQRSTKAELAKMFGIIKPSVIYILQQKDKIIATYLAEPDTRRKSLKGPEKHREADEPLLTWFTNMRAINKDLNNSILLQAAERIALRLGIEGALNES